MSTADRIKRPDTSELQWPDFAPGLVKKIYPMSVIKLFGKEWAARARKAATGHPRLTPVEQIQLAIAASIDPDKEPKYKNNKSPITRTLDPFAQGLVTEGKKLTELGRSLQIEKTKSVVDQSLCNILMLGIQARREDSNEPFEDISVYKEAVGIIEDAMETVKKVFSDPVFQGPGSKTTNWRSLFEQLIYARLFPDFYRPLIVTSTGGTAEAPPNAASAANILPALRLAQILREPRIDPKTQKKRPGYNARVLASFASEFAIECNGQDSDKVRSNRDITQDLYQACVRDFFKDLHDADIVSYETPPVSEIQAKIPEDYIEFTRQAMKNPHPLGPEFVTICNSLLNTAGLINSNGRISDEEKFESTLTYLLSHQLIFRDVQKPDGEIEPFVIKVGAPSEDRFSRFQQIVTEAYMNHKEGADRANIPMIPNATHPTKKEDGGKSWEYGQITLFYPKMGERPVYYPLKTGDKKHADELDIFQLAADPNQNGFATMKMNLDASISRYQELEKLLDRMKISPDKYIKVVREVAKKHASDSLTS